MNAHRNDTVFSVALFVIGAACAVLSFGYPADSSGFPRAMSVLLLIFSSVELLRNYRLRTRLAAKLAPAGGDSQVTPEGERPAELRAALLVFVSAPVYIVLARLFDFEIATFAYLLGGMFVLGIREPVKALLISVSVLVVVKLLFFTLLDVSRAPTLLFGS